MFIINNLILILEEKGLKQSDLCEAIGISSSTMTNWKNRGTDPPAKYIIPICEFLDISHYRLLTGEEKKSQVNQVDDDEQELLKYYHMLCDINKGKVIGTAKTLAELDISTNTKEQNKKRRINIRYSLIPVSAGAGEFLENENIEMRDFPDVIEARQADIVIPVDGESMEPMFSDGDELYVRLQPAVRIGEIGIFLRGKEGFVKEYAKDRLISLNPDYEDIYPNNYEEIVCIGKVLGKVEDE